MGILDEAIREHLELKRAHGADDSELKQLEDQAFGQSERPGAEAPPMPEGDGEGAAPDPAAEAPTEFMSQPDLDAGPAQPAEGEPAALNQEPPSVRREPAAGMADIQEPPSKPEEEEEVDEPVAEEAEEPVAEKVDEPVAEEQPAAEHEAIPQAPIEHSTEERHAIADQPTQMFDVEEEFAATEAPAPPDEDLVAEEINEARLGPAEPVSPPEPPAEDEDEDDDFFDEQRLSDELDQALEAPAQPEPEPEPISEEHEAVAAHTDEHEVVREQTDEHEAVRGETAEHAPAPDEDVLEETPDFLEETPEDDELWFEQKPPKDFDFDD